MTTPRVIVCQHGARQRYAVPRMLEQAGMLEALYTDSCEFSLLGKIAKTMGPLAKGSLKRLANRKIEDVPKNKIKSTDQPFSSVFFSSLFKKRPLKERFHKEHISLSKNMIKWGVQNADVIYSEHHASLDFLKLAKLKGKYIIVDVYSSPLTESIIDSEKKIIFNTGCDKSIEKSLPADKVLKECCETADVILCPSSWVVSGIHQIYPEYTNKIRICPYGCSIDYRGRVNKPVEGRFFWAGGDWIGKGLHYVAEAADELKKKYPEMEFRAAGITDPKVIKMPRFKNITFLGKLDRKKMEEQFLSADAFVFPTLSEGMSGVVLEAIAAGCPVITTKAAGIDDIEDGKSGLIIPTKDSNALAQAIEKIYFNGMLRDSISKGAITLAGNYTEEAWEQRLLNIMNSINT